MTATSSPPSAQQHVRFPFISSEAFVANTDKAALHSLQKLPLLPMIVRKFNEFAVDRILYAQNSAESIRCGPNQFPTVYNMMREACAVMHIPEPELYVKYEHTYNAYTAGVQRPFIALHSALVEDFSDDELLFIIGHEVGHMKCGHVLYSMVGRMLLPILDTLGQVTLGLGQLAGIGIVSAFYEWMRQAEFSCDRAGMLVCQNPQAAFTTVMKLGCGATRFNEEMNVDTFLEQARTHAESSGVEGLTKALLFVLYTRNLDHPQVVYRAKGLDEWHSSGAYDKILSGDYIRDATGGSQMGAQHKCPKCGLMLSASVRFCPRCGTDASGTAATPVGTTRASTHCTECGTEVPAGVNFCPNCGSPIAASAPAASHNAPPGTAPY